MVSFIIYDDDKYRKELYMKTIKKFLYPTCDCYKIYEFESYNKETERELKHIEGARVYIIDLDVRGVDPLKIARKVRDNRDFISPIILISSRKKAELLDHLQNILFLDIISEDEKIINNLYKSLCDAYKIINRHSVYTFSIFDEIYRIPYEDINYIIKNINDDSVTIFTKDDTYIDYITVKKLETKLCRDPRFFKSHRSCILNLYNVSFYDRKNNTVVFKDGTKTDLVSRNNRAHLAKKLISEGDSVDI